MKTFDPLPREGGIIGWLHRFVPKLEKELDRIEKKIPDKAPSIQETGAALLNDPEFKDAMYRYIKNREAKEQ